MLCEYAYYKSDDRNERLSCNNPKKIEEDDCFKDKCPLIYFCTISQRFENTTDMFECKYREAKNDR